VTVPWVRVFRPCIPRPRTPGFGGHETISCCPNAAEGFSVKPGLGLQSDQIVTACFRHGKSLIQSPGTARRSAARGLEDEGVWLAGRILKVDDRTSARAANIAFHIHFLGQRTEGIANLSAQDPRRERKPRKTGLFSRHRAPRAVIEAWPPIEKPQHRRIANCTTWSTCGTGVRGGEQVGDLSSEAAQATTKGPPSAAVPDYRRFPRMHGKIMTEISWRADPDIDVMPGCGPAMAAQSGARR